MSTQEVTQVQELKVDPNDEKTDGNSVDSQEEPIKKSDDGEISQLVEKISLQDKRNTKSTHRLTKEEKYSAQVEADSRSIFVGNITPDITPEIIEQHFQDCGVLKRITLLYDKHTGAPKGYAYVEFDSPNAQETALERNGSELKGSLINVYRKRTNLPGYHRNFLNQKPDFYYQNQWNLPYNGYPAYEDMNFYPQFDFQQQNPKNLGQFNKSYRGKFNQGSWNSKPSRDHPKNYHPSSTNQITESKQEILSEQQLSDNGNATRILEAANISRKPGNNTGEYTTKATAKEDTST